MTALIMDISMHAVMHQQISLPQPTDPQPVRAVITTARTALSDGVSTAMLTCSMQLHGV